MGCVLLKNFSIEHIYMCLKNVTFDLCYDLKSRWPEIEQYQKKINNNFRIDLVDKKKHS